MSEQTKQKLLSTINLDALVEDIVYMFAHYNNLTEEDVAEIIDNIYDNCDVHEIFYTTFKSHFKRKDHLEKYVELQATAINAQDDFTGTLESVIINEVNKFLPEDKKIPEEVVH